MTAIKQSPLKRVLIIRFSSIGDIVLTSPVIRCLHEQMPGVEVHYLTKEKFLPVLSANPYIYKVHVLKDDLAPVIRELKKLDFDFIVDLHKNLRSSRVKMALKKPSGTFNKLNVEKWLIVNFKIDRLPHVHIVDRYFEAVKSLGVKNDGKGLDYFIPEEDRVGRADLPEGFDHDFIAFAIGGMHYTKMIPEERILELVELLNMPVVLLGGAADRERGSHVVSATEKNVYNACGELNINQSASIVSMASKVLTNDTGLMHIAAAFKKDIYSFWGNTIPAFGMYPYLPEGEGRSTILEVKDLSCRPCSKIGHDRCPKKHFRCMMDIDMQALAAILNK